MGRVEFNGLNNAFLRRRLTFIIDYFALEQNKTAFPKCLQTCVKANPEQIHNCLKKDNKIQT